LSIADCDQFAASFFVDGIAERNCRASAHLRSNSDCSTLSPVAAHIVWKGKSARSFDGRDT